MERQQLERMAESFEEMREFSYDFFIFYEQTKVQLLSNQFQLLQSLATINLAFVAIVIATKTFQINSLWTSAFAASILLLIFTTAYVRESIDERDRSLNREEATMEKNENDLLKVISEAKQSNDFSKFTGYIEQRRADTTQNQRETQPLVYVGEMAVFLFHCGLFLSICATVYALQNLTFDPVIALVGAICLSFIVAFCNWSTSTAIYISKLLQLPLKNVVPPKV